jgi:hypothetical protein
VASSQNMSSTSLMASSEEMAILSSTVGIVEQFSGGTAGSAATDWDNETTSDLLTFSPEYGGGEEIDNSSPFCR